MRLVPADPTPPIPDNETLFDVFIISSISLNVSLRSTNNGSLSKGTIKIAEVVLEKPLEPQVSASDPTIPRKLSPMCAGGRRNQVDDMTSNYIFQTIRKKPEFMSPTSSEYYIGENRNRKCKDMTTGRVCLRLRVI